LLQVSKHHQIHFEISGNPEGQPVLLLHGGPGSGSNPDQQRLFDPERFTIIQFDQRGCGKSTPLGLLTDNTTPHLIADIKLLLETLKHKQVHLFGGSWGSTLALSFALEYPEKVKSLLLYGVFLCRPRELQALYFKGGIAHQIYPELFNQYLSLLPQEDQDNPIEGYFKLFNNPHNGRRNKALLMWTRLEKRLSKLIVTETDLASELSDPQFVLSHSLIENHYFRHAGFVNGDEMLMEAPRKLQDTPTHIIAGRYDLVCPIITAHELHTALPHSTMTIVPASGHSFREPGITNAIIDTTRHLA
jgi:proline iminopeptidase